MEKLKSDSIAELNLPNYIHNALIANGISSISQLIEQSETNELYDRLFKLSTEDYDVIDSHLSIFGLKLYDKGRHLTRNKRLYAIGIIDSERMRKYNGIYRIGELIKLTKKELKSLPLMTEEKYKDVIDKVHESGLKFADEVEEPIEIGLKPLAILHLTLRPLSALIRSGINNISMLTAHTIKELMDIYNMEEKSLNEIIEKVHLLGLKFADEPKEEEIITQNDIIEPINTPISEQMNQSKLDKIARIQELQKQIIALQQEQSQLMQELQEEISKGDTNARQNR